MKKMILNGIPAILILAILFFVLYWFMQYDTSDNKANIEFIKSHCYNGQVLDMQNEISVRYVEDVKWYYDKNKTIVIEYGKILLKYKTKDFVKEDTLKDLQDIFITVKQNKDTLALTLYFQGEEMTEYVKR